MADRYWVGGTGNWNDTAHWSDETGGTGGETVPTSTDNVYIDGNSGSGTITLNVNAECGSFNQNKMTFDANDYNITALAFLFTADTGLTPTVIMGNGIWEGQTWAIFEYNEELVTITPETSTIKIKLTEQSENVFFGGGKTYNNLWIDADGFGVIVTGSNIFNELKISAGSTVQFEQTKTQTVTTFTVTGTVGNLITLESYGATPGGVVDYGINNYGTGYSIDDLITVTGGDSNFTFIVYDVDGSGTVIDCGADTMGSGYSTGNNIATTGGTGTGFTVNITEVNPPLEQFTLSKSSGTVECDYLDLSNSNATGGATWYAGSNSADTSNNDGWIFTDVPSSGNTSNFFQLF